MKRLTYALVLLLVFLAGVLVGYFCFFSKETKLASKESQILYWVAPMDPSYRRDKPGKSPMGMDLVPVYAKANAVQGTIKITPAVENNLGVRTEIIAQHDLPRMIDTVGYITTDENNIEHIHAYTEGWVKKLHIKTLGESVAQAQTVLELYSPALISAQEELLLALKNNNAALIMAGEKKLLTLGMSRSQINKIKHDKKIATHVKLLSTRGGIVTQLNVREGKFIKPETDLMTITDLSQIWIIAEVFERQANWVKEGDIAIATLSSMPGKLWQGKVDYVYPELDGKTHTLRVRLIFPNLDLTMKPNMYANIKILGHPIKSVLALPRTALIRSGSGDRVILSLGKGRFKVQAVTVGIESGEYYQLISGLKAGDAIVTSAQFLLDSESNLKASFDRLQANSMSGSKTIVSNGPAEFIGMGQVEKIDYQKRVITIRHQPIAALNMPHMSMALMVDKHIDLATISAQDKVHFALVKHGKNNYLIKKIHVIHKQMPPIQ